MPQEARREQHPQPLEWAGVREIGAELLPTPTLESWRAVFLEPQDGQGGLALRLLMVVLSSKDSLQWLQMNS